MIIFGTRGVRFTKAQGQFQCPQCACQQPYKHKNVRRFFTLYFIPLIPLDSLGEYIECQVCKNTFVTRVLEYEKPEDKLSQFLSEYQKAVKKVLILMLLADGIIDDREKFEIKAQYKDLTGHDLQIEDLNKEIEKVQFENMDVKTYLSSISSTLNSQGKENILKAGFAVAASDNILDSTEMNLIHEMGVAMEMTTHHVKGILLHLTEEFEAQKINFN